MASVDPYLNFPGNCEAAFNFYKEVFQSEFKFVMRTGDAPRPPGAPPLSPEDAKRIIHVALPIVGGATLMGSDVPETVEKVVVGNNLYISLTVDSKEDVDRLYGALRTDGVVQTELKDQFWGEYFGAVSDKFGTRWMITHRKK